MPVEHQVLALAHPDVAVAVGARETDDLEPLVVGEPPHRDAQAHVVRAGGVLVDPEVVLAFAGPQRLAGPGRLAADPEPQLLGHPVGAHLVHEHAEPVHGLQLELAELPVHLQRRPDRVGHLVGPHEQVERVGDPWRVREPAAGVDVEPERAVGATRGRERQAVELHGGAVGRAAGRHDLPLPREERRERLLLERERPELVQERRHRQVPARVLAVDRAGGRVPHRVAARLGAREAHLVEAPPDLGELVEPHPVDLDVLARRDLAEPVGLDVVVPPVAEVADHAGHARELVGADPAARDPDPEHEPVLLAVVVDAHQAHPSDGEHALARLDLGPGVDVVRLDRSLDGRADLGRSLRPVEHLLIGHAFAPCRWLSLGVPSSWTEQWMPHSLFVFSSHHQRPARSDSPGRTGRVHGAQPIDA